MSTALNIPKKAKIYLNKPYVQVYWNIAARVLTSRWSGFCTFDEIKAIGKRIVDAVIFEKAKKVLYDAREIEILDESSQKYIAEEFTKQMIDAGISYSATVFPDDVFAKFSIDDIQGHQTSSNISSSSNNKYFHSVDEAITWLNSK